MKSEQRPQDSQLFVQPANPLAQDDAQNLDLEQELILEQYTLWKKNTPHLYDILQQQGIQWPSLTVEWLPTHDIPQTSQFSVQKLLVGTHTTGNDQNYIKVLRVRMPLPEAKLEDVQAKLDQELKYDQRSARQNSSRNAIITQTIIAHQGDIHKARVMPSKSNIFATMSETGSIYIWDYSKHPSKPKIGEQRHHQLHLVGHQREGYGLDWNSKMEGKLVSGAFDWKIILWDIASASKLNTQLAPVRQISTKLKQVNDVKWHRFDPDLFGSIHDDGVVALWDARDSQETVNKFRAHTDDGIALDFNYQNAYLLATGGDDNSVKVWDLRKPKIALMELQGHQNGVQTVAFSPFHQMVLASGSKDRRVNWWNLHDIVKSAEQLKPPILSKLRFDRKAEEQQFETPKGLIFIHAGHTGQVSDISWNKNEKMVMASVAEDNSVEVFSWRSQKYSSPVYSEN